MRSEERIDYICDGLKKMWHEVPDQRLGQVLYNYIYGADCMSAFYVEDDVVERRIKEFNENN